MLKKHVCRDPDQDFRVLRYMIEEAKKQLEKE